MPSLSDDDNHNDDDDSEGDTDDNDGNGDGDHAIKNCARRTHTPVFRSRYQMVSS